MPPIFSYTIEPAVDHFYPNHPEAPQRVLGISDSIDHLHLDPTLAERIDIDKTTLAQVESILPSVHDAAYLASLQTLCATLGPSPTAVRDPEDPDGPTYATCHTYTRALSAAAAAVALVRRVVATSPPVTESVESDGHTTATVLPVSAFSLCRPPGHHATPNEAMGFCWINSVAVAARYAQKCLGLEKVLILDFDVHHGNGTQDIFYNDPSVLFIDIHQLDVWPSTGAADETGQGTTINIPLPLGSGHKAALSVFEHIVRPAARRFQPDIVLVSAGFDAHEADPLEELKFQSFTYHALALELKVLAEELCRGRLVFFLEGGYNVAALSESVAESVRALVGLPSACDLRDIEEPDAAIQDAIQHVKKLHSL